MNPLAQTLRGRREQLGLSLREVQARTGISNAHLSQIETGKIERPEIGLLFELAEAYDLDFVELMVQSGQLPAPSKGSERALTAAALRAVGRLPLHQKAETLNFVRRLAQKGHPQAPDVAAGQDARRRVEAIAERALQAAGVAGIVPTPLPAIAAVAGVTAKRDIGELPEEFSRQKPGRWKEILGAVVFATREIYVDEALPQRRERFTEAHEIAHVLIPWHESVFQIDDERRLFYGTDEPLEDEANAAAAHLLFQGHRYHERAKDDDQLSIATPIELAETHGASMHASIRYFVEQHDEPVAVLLCGRYQQFDGTLPIWRSFESSSFARRFGRFTDHVPTSGLPKDEDYVLGQLASASFDAAEPVADTVTLEDADGARQQFLAEALFNRFSVFILVTPKRRARRRR